MLRHGSYISKESLSKEIDVVAKSMYIPHIPREQASIMEAAEAKRPTPLWELFCRGWLSADMWDIGQCHSKKQTVERLTFVSLPNHGPGPRPRPFANASRFQQKHVLAQSCVSQIETWCLFMFLKAEGDQCSTTKPDKCTFSRTA